MHMRRVDCGRDSSRRIVDYVFLSRVGFGLRLIMGFGLVLSLSGSLILPLVFIDQVSASPW